MQFLVTRVNTIRLLYKKKKKSGLRNENMNYKLARNCSIRINPFLLKEKEKETKLKNVENSKMESEFLTKTT